MHKIPDTPADRFTDSRSTTTPVIVRHELVDLIATIIIAGSIPTPLCKSIATTTSPESIRHEAPIHKGLTYKERRHELVERIVEEREAWSREAEAKLAGLTARRVQEPTAGPAADPRQIDLEEAIVSAGVRLTPAQLMLGAEAARAEGAAQFDVQAVYADWLLAAARRQDRLRNPAGHWIDYCKRRAQQQKREDG